MSLAQSLADFKVAVTQCESLIANAHGVDAAGNPLLPAIDQQQITAAAFLNMFIAWEKFLEGSLIELMTGAQTINGNQPVRYVLPLNALAANNMVQGYNRNYFQYARHDQFRFHVNLYFENGYPFEPHFGGIMADLGDTKTIRNACAHIDSSTQRALEGLALRIFGQPRLGISVYQLLMSIDPRAGPGETVFVYCRKKLVTAAELIAQG